MKKRGFRLTKFQIAIIIAIALVAFIAFMDVKGYNLWQAIGKGRDYTYGLQGELLPGFGSFFYSWAFALIIIIPLLYFLFYRKDKTEALAIGLTSYILLQFGLADILYFLFKWEMMPKTLPWLSKHRFIGRISSALGYSDATRTSLFISVALGIVLTVLIVKILKKI